MGIKYCNLFDEKNTGQYGPYLHDSDTAQNYGEGQVDPKGAGWAKNIQEQLDRAKGFTYVEWDNPDAYPVSAVLDAISRTEKAGLKVIAKNPGIVPGDDVSYVKRCYGIIVEEGAGTPLEMDKLRRDAGKPDLPVWFVAFGDGKAWATQTANEARQYTNMGVTYSTQGEYGNSTDILKPVPPQDVFPAKPIVPPVVEPDPGVPYAVDYRTKWNNMQILPSRQTAVTAIAAGILKDKQRYIAIELATGVPWYMVGVLHMRESDRDFNTYLGNGEPLNRKTRLVPVGRGPFASFEAGAIDALKYDGLDKFSSWPVARICYECEKFNGMGYHNKGVPSPYLWSFSNQYKSGKYTSDGVYSSGAVDQQCGVMPVIAKLMELDKTIQIERATVSPPLIPPIVPSTVPVLPSVLTRSEFAAAVFLAMAAKRYRFDGAAGQKNIIYVEGWTRNADDTFVKNSDQPDLFNDLRCLFDNLGTLLGAYQATTRPGKYYTENRLNSGGAANIVPGQYQAWEVGLHRGLYEALVQRGTLKVARDNNEDYSRAGDVVETGDYEGINQHHGSDANTIGPHSAGCLVGRFVKSHEEFMALVKQDPRYVADHGYRFWSAILERDDIK